MSWEYYQGILERIQTIEFNRHITTARLAWQFHSFIAGLGKQKSPLTVEDFLPPIARSKAEEASKWSRGEALGLRWMDHQKVLKQKELDALQFIGYGMDEVRKALPELYRK